MSFSSPDHLERVLVECSFLPTLRVARDVAVFQEKFARGFSYSSLGVKNPFLAAQSSTPGYRFESSKVGVTMELFEDSFSFSVTKYPGFDTFQNKVVTILASLTELFAISTFHRVGLRYSNTWIFVPDDGQYRLGDFFAPHLNLDHPDCANPRQFYLDLATALPDGGLNSRSTFRTQKLDASEPGLGGHTECGVYTLDLDAYHQGVIAPIDLHPCLSNLHREIKLGYTRHVKEGTLR